MTDTLLEQIKELRGVMQVTPKGIAIPLTLHFALQMADRIIADAEKIEGLIQTIESQKQTNLTILKKARKNHDHFR